MAENPIVESRAPKRPDPDKDGGTFVSDARMKLEWANERIEQMAALINDGIEPAETVGEDYNPFA